MKRVYVINLDGHSEPKTPIRCTDEAKELQALLANNFDLLDVTIHSPLS